MEYTKSIGDIYETYTGEPEEIAKLMQLQELKESLVALSLEDKIFHVKMEQCKTIAPLLRYSISKGAATIIEIVH